MKGRYVVIESGHGEWLVCDTLQLSDPVAVSFTEGEAQAIKTLIETNHCKYKRLVSAKP